MDCLRREGDAGEISRCERRSGGREAGERFCCGRGFSWKVVVLS